MRNKFSFSALLLLLAACATQTDIQARYRDDNQGCRDYAEANIDQYLPQGKATTIADRNAQMVTMFSDCMAQRSWQVAKPKKAEEVANTGPLPSPNYPMWPATTARVGFPQPVPAPAMTPTPITPLPSVSTYQPMSAPIAAQPQAPAMYRPSYAPVPARGF